MDIVSVNWLHDNLNMPHLVVLDATVPKVGSSPAKASHRKIPKAIFFDLKHTFSRPNAPFPNTVPTSEQFQAGARKIGIHKSSIIVVYDEQGMYSSPRAWYLFKAFGHDKVAVLDGGLPAWIAAGFPTQQKKALAAMEGDFEARYRPEYFIDLEELRALEGTSEQVVLDARSADRFTGKVSEPREGLRSGTIPGSMNLPYTHLFSGGYLKSSEELRTIFNETSGDAEKLIMSCGSGLTACILALGAKLAGRQNISVYDGSWTEYGTLIDP